MDRSVQDRRADDMQLRLLRPVDRSGAAGQRGISRRQKIGMGLQAPEGEELSRSRAIHPAPLSRRLEDIGREHGQDALTTLSPRLLALTLSRKALVRSH